MSHRTLYLIDAHAYIHRAYHALPPLTSPKGIMVNAVFGFTRLLLKIIREKKPDFCAVCFDHPAPTLRKQLYPDYKATRKAVDKDLVIQIPVVRRTVELLGLAAVDKEGYEADDLIATLACRAAEEGIEVVIVSGDKDTLQLVSPCISVWNIHRDILITPETLMQQKGIEPARVTDLYALMGDSSDNIPGVAGIGEKTALKIVHEFGSIERIYERLEELPEKIRAKLAAGREAAFLSKKLFALDSAVPVPQPLSAMPGVLPEASADLIAHFNDLGFNSLLSELTVREIPATFSKSYEVITDVAKLKTILSAFDEKGSFALDVETTGLDVRHARAVGISLCAELHRAWYIPLHDPSSEIFQTMKSFLQKQGHAIIGHNLKFDFLVLKHNGILLPDLFFDTMIASYLLNPSRNTHRLKNLALECGAFKMMEYEDLVGKGKNAVPIEQVPIEKLKDYACADADATFMLYELFSKDLEHKNLNNLFYGVEMPLALILADMEETGITVERQYVETLKKDFSAKRKSLTSDIYQAAGKEFNIHSPKQLSEVLFDTLKLPVVKRTKTGFSTDDEVLEELSAHHCLPRLLREYREIQKLESTYIDGLQDTMDPVTDRVHTSFNQTITATGRLSSSDPNLQNIPIRSEQGRLIRRIFVPEKGRVFISADYSQIDLRVLAHLSKDPVMVEAFMSGGDVHRATAAEIYHVSPEDVSDEMRSRAKAINFGIVYGQQAFGLAHSLGISHKEAKQFIEDYFRRYSGVKKWIDETLQAAQVTGMVSTIRGRIRYLPELNTGQPRMRSFGERIAVNTPIQGSSADIIKTAMINISRRLSEEKLASKILLQVHDDVLLEVPEKEIHAVVSLLKHEMEHAVPLSVPLSVDIKKGYNWRDLEKWLP